MRLHPRDGPVERRVEVEHDVDEPVHVVPAQGAVDAVEPVVQVLDLASRRDVLAAPLLERRAQPVYETIIEEVFETVTTTTTIYVDPTDLPSSVIGAFYEDSASSPTRPGASRARPDRRP